MSTKPVLSRPPPATNDTPPFPVAHSANGASLDALLHQLERVDGVLRQHVLALYHDERDPIEDYLQATSRIRVAEAGLHPSPASPQNETARCLVLDQLATRFALTAFETDVLLLGLLPYFDSRLHTVFAFAHARQLQKLPSFDLALTALCPDPMERIVQDGAFYPHSSLLKHQLIGVAKTGEQQGEGWSQTTFLTDISVYQFLTERRYLPAQLQACAEWLTQRASWCPAPVALAVEALRAHAAGGAAPALVLMLRGARDTGRAAAIHSAATALHREVLHLDLALLPENDKDAVQVCIQACRDVRMRAACLLLRSLEDLHEKRPALFAALSLLLRQPGLMAVCLCETYPPALPHVHQILVDVPPPTMVEKEALLRSALESVALSHLDVPSLCRTLHFTRATLPAIIEEARHYRTLRDPCSNVIESDLRRASRLHSQQDFGKLAKRIEPKRSLDDLVLPAGLRQQLLEVAIATKHRQAVLEKGFDTKISYGTGISALFHGDSGTGKTMAAEALAHQLGVGLIRVDLASIVSKYIGETEKNLSSLFDLAQADISVLFFDEADALFGKRTNVKDAKDRHANIEVSYLLQRLEEHPGLVILSTNNRGALDDAFSRRFTFIARFAFPDAGLRECLWRSIWPTAVRVGDDVDFAILAQRAQLTGASIRNIALLATWLAEEERSPSVCFRHIDQAFRRELGKVGRLEL